MSMVEEITHPVLDRSAPSKPQVQIDEAITLAEFRYYTLHRICIHN